MMAAFYAEVAARLAGGGLPFMNYGYADPSGDYAWVHASDQPYKYNLSLVRRVLRGVPLAGASVLECGSGRGGNCSYLANYSSAARITGLDLCEGHVRLCAREMAPRGIQFVCGDAARMPFACSRFDVLLNVESSHCYPDLAAFLSEVRRVLRPGGFFAYTDFWSLELFPYDWDSRREALAACGMPVLREEDISEEVYAALHCEDGISQSVKQLETPENTELIESVLRANVAMRYSLASAQCRYKLWLLQKPQP